MSGYHTSLDTIKIERKVITETITVVPPPRRTNWALTAGPSAIYATNKRVYVGAGVTLGFAVKSSH